MVLGELATHYASLIGTCKKDDADTTFGLHTEPGQHGMFYIGDKPIQVAGKDLIIDGKMYNVHKDYGILL